MPTTNKTFRGDSVAVQQVTRITAPTAAGQIALTINDKTLSFDSWDIDEIVDAWNGESDPIDPVSETEEFSDITASADGDDLILTADTAGKPFFVSATVAGDALTNEVQTVTIGHSPTGGTFTLTYSGQTTSGIAYNASAATVQAALEALSNISVGDVAVTGNAGGPWAVKFTGALAGTDVALMTASAASLTGGDAAITITTLNNGSTGQSEVQVVTVNGGPSGGTFTLSFGGQTTGTIAYNASAATVQTALRALSTIGGTNVAVSGSAGGPYTCTFQNSLASTPLPLISGNAAGLTGSSLNATITTVTPGVTGQDLVMTVVLGDRAFDDPDFLYYHARYHNGTAWEVSAANLDKNSSAATLQAALESLPSIGAGNVQVTKLGDTLTLTFIGDLHATNAVVTRIMQSHLAFSRDSPYFDFIYPSLVTVPTSGTNEVQRVAIAGTPTAGSFTLTWNGQTTAPIAYNASAATVKAALEALSNIGAGGLTGGGGALPGTAVDITFSGNGLQATDVVAMTIDFTNLKIPVVATTEGVAGVSDTQTLSISGSPFGGTFTLTIGGDTTSAIARNANAATVQSALEALAGVGSGKVTCSGGPLPNATITAVFDPSLGDVAQMTATPTLHNGTVSVAETITGGFAFVITEETRSVGPNHWDDPGNWTPHGVPQTGEAVELAGGAADLLYGLAQRSTFTADTATDRLTLATGRKTFLDGQKVRVRNSGGALPTGLTAGTDYYVINAGVVGDAKLQLSTTSGGSAVNITGAGSGTQTIEVLLDELRAGLRFGFAVGLTPVTEADNREYRSTYLQIGATSIVIGAGEGSGSGRLKIDTGGVQTALRIVDTGGSIDPDSPAFQWKGDHASNTLEQVNGDVGVALQSMETATLASIKQRAGTLELGRGVTVSGVIDKTGGILIANEANSGNLLLKG